jgi:hypothetical protein
MDKIGYLQELYKRVYMLNLILLPELHNANYNQQHTKNIDELLDLDRILSSDVAKDHIGSLDDSTSDDSLNKMISRFEKDIERLNRIRLEMNTMRKFELN